MAKAKSWTHYRNEANKHSLKHKTQKPSFTANLNENKRIFKKWPFCRDFFCDLIAANLLVSQTKSLGIAPQFYANFSSRGTKSTWVLVTRVKTFYRA